MRLYLKIGISDLFGWLSSAFFTPLKFPARHILLSDLSSQFALLKSANTLPMSLATLRLPIAAVLGGVNLTSFSPTMRDCCRITNCQSLRQATLYFARASSKSFVMILKFTLICRLVLGLFQLVRALREQIPNICETAFRCIRQLRLCGDIRRQVPTPKISY